MTERFGQGDILDARPLLMLGDSITTDHISPVNAICSGSPAVYLENLGVVPADFNTLLARRGNHAVMVRANFSNNRLANEMVAGQEGGSGRHMPSGEVMTIHEAAQRYRAAGTALVVLAGFSRDWAAKGTRLLGVRG